MHYQRFRYTKKSNPGNLKYTEDNSEKEEMQHIVPIGFGDSTRFPIKCVTKIDPSIKVSSASDIIKLPQIVQVRGEFSEETAEEFANAFHVAENNGQPVIPIVIDSYGGDIYALLSMIDIIQASSVPVATIVTGKAMSAGAVLLSCGHEGMRFASPHATIMIHSAWESGISGNADEMKVNAEELMRLNHKVLEIMSLNCGHGKDYYTKIMNQKKNTDWFINSKEAKKHNLINNIRIPEFHIEVTSKTEFK
jgi:ATP-dependent Clp protease, protease subunit